MGNIREYYQLKKYSGDVGIEVEIEGEGLPERLVGWKAVHDGSLRGNALEYVTNGPVKIEGVDLVINTLTEGFKANGGKIYDSVRAGVHVHVNVQELTHTQLATFACMYYVFENVLVKFCGDTRDGNLFCLSTSYADYIQVLVKRGFSLANLGVLHTDKIRYSSMNWKPVVQYGSLEFRSMRTPTDLSIVVTWVKLLHKLLESSKLYATPEEIIQDFSMNTPKDFMSKTFGELTKYIECEGSVAMICDGMYNSQDIAFCTDWSALEDKVSKVLEDKAKEEEAFKKVFAHAVQNNKVIIDEFHEEDEQEDLED